MASVRKRKWTHKGVESEAWVVEYTDQGAKRRRKTFKKKRDADAYRSKVEVEIEQGTHISGVREKTVEYVCGEYLKWMDDRERDGRIGWNHKLRVDSHIKAHIIPELGRKVIGSLTIRDVESFYRMLIMEKAHQPATARVMVSIVGRLEEFAIKRKWARASVALQAQKELRGIKSDKIAVFSKNHAQSILRAATEVRAGHRPRHQFMLRCAIHLAALCGLRYGEIFGLRLENVDIPNRMLRIRHNLLDNDVLKSPKTKAGVRDVPMPPVVADLLQQWMDTLYIKNERELIFRSHGGKKFHVQAFWIMWRSLLKAAGVGTIDRNGKQYHFHALRHFAASWMIDNHLPLTDVAEMMGHAGFDVTLQVYAHPIREKRERATAMDNAAALLLS